jgi:serine/threonine protein kinase/Flp pilus assembly protein TadD
MSPDDQAAEQAPAAEDPRVLQAVEEFLAAQRAGRLPDRGEFLARHADIAPALAECLDGLDFIQAAAPRLQAPAGAAPASPLGDFRLLRVVGRGGMGIVYEAEQVSLGRRVALKVLPFAAALDGRQLQRFKNEAHAAAQLHHSNIVPVYAVGCEHGMHFYAMQFIDGQTLARVIADLRRQAGRDPADPAASTGTDAAVADELASGRWAPPGAAAETRAAASVTPPGGGPGFLFGPAYFRTVAQLGIQAAEALEHAHGLGVVHRDVKPANLMVDGRGHLWVTDFGLAQVQSDTRLTMTGDVLGTLRYMSPEQALGRREVIDHRTDLYALGATLYELLTLEPACDGTDRQELLRQIASEEPRPPRRLNKAVPAELETVVLKALEKGPAERYASAQDLADDLRRFLEDRPIRARRPSLPQRARKWARRHRPVVWSAAAVLALTATVLAGSIGWAMRDRGARRAAAEDKARAALEEAVNLKDEEKWPEAQNAIRRAQGILAGVGADPGLSEQVEELARDLEMVRLLEAARVKPGFGIKDGDADWEGSQAAYAAAFGWYGLEVEGLDPREAAERVRSRPIRLQLAAALDDWAYARRKSGLPGWDRLLAVSRAADPDPWRDRLRDALRGNDPKALQELAASVRGHHVPVVTALLLARLTRGTAAVEQTVVVLRQVRQRHPGDFWVNEQLGECLFVLRPPRLEEAVRYYTAAVAIRPQSHGAHYNLSNALGFIGLRDEAVAEGREAVRLKGDVPAYRRHLALELGRQGEFAEAQQHMTEAIRLQRAAWQLNPNDPRLRRVLARGYTFVADALIRLSDHSEAAKAAGELPRVRPDSWAYCRTLELLARCVGLAEQDARLTAGQRRATAQAYADQVRQLLQEAQQRFSGDAAGLQYLAWFLANRPDVRFRDAQTAVALARRAAQLAPRDGTCWLTLGEASYRAGDWKAAQAALEKAGALRQGGDCADWFFLAMTSWQRGDREQARRWYDRATRWMQTHSPAPDWPRFRAEATALLSGARILRSFEGHEAPVTQAALSPDGRLALSSGEDSTARLWEVATGNELGRLGGHTGWVLSAAFSPDGRRIVTSEHHHLRLWDVETRGELRRFTGHTGVISALAFAPDGKHLLSGSGGDPTVRLWDVETGQELRRFAGHAGGVHGVAFAPDGRRAVTAGQDGMVRLWDVQAGRALRHFTGHTGAAVSVAFSPDGRRLLSGGEDRTLRLWDAETGEGLRRFAGHTGGVRTVAFSPDGRQALSGADDATARLWDVETGRELYCFRGHGGGVRAVALSPDGRRILSAGGDASVYLWELPPPGREAPGKDSDRLENGPAVPARAPAGASARPIP